MKDIAFSTRPWEKKVRSIACSDVLPPVSKSQMI